MGFSDIRRPRVCVLTYRSLTHLVRLAEVKLQDRADVIVDEYSLDDAVLHAHELYGSTNFDVIVSPASVAEELRTQIDKPVVSIELQGVDLFRAIKQASYVSNHVALLAHPAVVPELDWLEPILSVKLTRRTYLDMTAAREQLSSLAQAGFTVVVGSSMVVALAEGYGLQGMLIHGITSVEHALRDAVSIAERAIREARRFDHLNTAFARLQEAILTVDSRNRITAINPPMLRILGIERGNPIGRRLSDVSTELSLSAVLTGHEDEEERVIQLSRGTFLMTRSVIQDGGGLTGALLTLRDAGAIHRADTTIRSQRRTKSVTARYSFDLITGTSAALERARAIAQRCARTSSTVLIEGETGTGKELFAQAIHNASARQHGPFVALNCAAFPESLLESELFGYDEGSFTGSRKGGKAGLLEAAHTGTLFLDEIGDMPLSLQTRLLRVLQEREVLRLGSNAPISIDVRIIAATHRCLPERIAQNLFRADLYYRLNILRLVLPPLRDRSEDIPALARQLLEGKLRAVGSAQSVDSVLAPLLPLLSRYQWPGNIREMDNLMERFAVFLLGVRDPAEVDFSAFLQETPELAELQDETFEESAEGIDEERIVAAIQAAGGNRQLAAQSLGISRTTLWRRLKEIEAS